MWFSLETTKHLLTGRLLTFYVFLLCFIVSALEYKKVKETLTLIT